MTKIIDLNGTWKLRWDDGQRGDRLPRLLRPDVDLSRAWDATVPGAVHLDLCKAGLLGEPTLGLNVLAARWVEETMWHYRRTFKVPKLAADERAWLVLEGLDLAAGIYINGHAVARHENAFYPCQVDVTEHLVAGENNLVVDIESGLFHARDRCANGLGINIDNQLTKRPWLRKPQFSHGWDWSPRLLNVGIHGPVRLEIVCAARVRQFALRGDLSADLQTGTITANVSVTGLQNAPLGGVLNLHVHETGQRIRTTVQIKPGLNRLETGATVVSPKLWWPAGHGNQARYTVTVSLEIKGKSIARTTRQIGFRHVRVNQEKHPTAGTYFILEINGKPIFCKGANFVPADIILARIDRHRYDTLVDLALEANFNFLRVWGGGIYEHDYFYDLCDARGILVWQEFIFACAKYPTTDEKLLADIKEEAAYQVRRLAHHPSLIAWCGNNEMEQGAWEWGYEHGQAFPDYALFHLVLPRLLQAEDPGRYYQPSSPFSPGGVSPTSDITGDQHPWSIGFQNNDFYGYRNMVCRFPNEGGILGPPALPTVKACLEPGTQHPGSFAWEIHDNAIASWGDGKPYPDLMLQHWLGKSLEKMTLEDYVYWGGVVQGEGLSEYIKNFRRRMFDSSAAIFWMYNDCWPVTRSWTIVDYYLRRTPAFWPVRRAMAKLTVVLVRQGDKVKIFGVNDGPAFRGTLRYGLLALAGGYPQDHTQTVMLPSNTSTELAEFSARQWEKLGKTTHAGFALLMDDAGHEIARDRLLLVPFKDMRWPRTRLQVRLRQGQAIFQSSTFAWRVCLDLDGEKSWPDNFFDVFPGISTVLPWPSQLGTPQVLRIGNDLMHPS